MRKRFYAIFLLLLLLVVSVAVVISPTFSTKDVSRSAPNKEVDLPLILNDEKDIKLLFFGYAGCTKICTPRLYELAKFYDSLPPEIQKRTGIEFVDISYPTDKELPQKFASSFNPSFKGIYLDEKVLRDYTKEFNVYFSNSLIDKGEIDHTANLYLLKKSKTKKSIRYIYNSHPYDFKQIRSDIEELYHE